MTQKFDTLLTSLLNEMVPAHADYESGAMGSKVSQKISELPGKSQHWKYLQELDPEVRASIVKQIIDHVFTDNDDNTYSASIHNVKGLKLAIEKAIRAVAESNPQFKPTSKTLIGFLVDRLANKELLGKVKYTTINGEDLVLDKDITQKEVRQALNKALSKENDFSDENSQNDTEVDDEQEATDLTYIPHHEYYLKNYDEIPSGTLQGDLQIAFDRLSGLAGEVHTGHEFAKVLSKSNLKPYFLQQLLNYKVLEPAETENISDVGDTEGFNEPEEDYMNRITKHAREDYMSSSPKSSFGGEDVFG
jgi:hypothetical protein